jgi:hypothetical protein
MPAPIWLCFTKLAAKQKVPFTGKFRRRWSLRPTPLFSVKCILAIFEPDKIHPTTTQWDWIMIQIRLSQTCPLRRVENVTPVSGPRIVDDDVEDIILLQYSAQPPQQLW